MKDRLQQLLRIRKREETLAEGALAAATRRRMTAQTVYEDLLRQDTLVSTTPQPRTLPELLALRMQGIAAQESLMQAAGVIEERTHAEDNARAARTVAAMRRHSVRRVIERREAEKQLHAQRAAQRALSELARLSVAER